MRRTTKKFKIKKTAFYPTPFYHNYQTHTHTHSGLYSVQVLPTLNSLSNTHTVIVNMFDRKKGRTSNKILKRSYIITVKHIYGRTLVRSIICTNTVRPSST